MTQTVVYDNRWVVPYNRYLLNRFAAHVNVVKCSQSVTACRYITKYLHKGGDRAELSFRSANQPDEIKAFVQGRYTSAHEGIYRLMSYAMHFNSHSVFLIESLALVIESVFITNITNYKTRKSVVFQFINRLLYYIIVIVNK